MMMRPPEMPPDPLADHAEADTMSSLHTETTAPRARTNRKWKVRCQHVGQRRFAVYKPDDPFNPRETFRTLQQAYRYAAARADNDAALYALPEGIQLGEE
jgi:hypothetical protein